MTYNNDQINIIEILIEISDALGVDISSITREDFLEATEFSKYKIVKEFGSFTDLKIQAKAYKENSSNDATIENEEHTSEVNDLSYEDKYVYNKELDKYVFLTEKFLSKNIVLPGDVVRNIITSYSNFDNEPSTINQISNNFKLPRKVVIELLKLLGITHDSLPITPEEVTSNNEDVIVEGIMEKKKFSIYQRLMKEDWKATQESAKKWREFECGVLNPFEKTLENFSPKVEVLTRSNKQIPTDNYTLVVGLSDLHFGSMENGDFMFFGKSYDLNAAETIVHDYLIDVITLIERKGTLPESIVVLLLGDILDSINGFTTKGTPIRTAFRGSQQFNAAYEMLYHFIASLSTYTDGSTLVKGVPGNHDEFGDWVLYKMLDTSFRLEDSVDFEYVYGNRWLPFKIYDNLFVIEHGYSPQYKSKLPASGSAREAFIQRVLLQHPELLVNVYQKYYIAADMHTAALEEVNQFEFIRFSSPVLGSEYADNNVLSSRPRQNSLIVDKYGVASFNQHYFDKRD